MNPATTIDTTKSEAAEELPARLRLAIVRTARRLRQEAGGELGPATAAALGTIERRGPLSPSELAEHEGIKRPTVARILGHLEKDDLVTRVRDPQDGRSSILSITPAGRALLRKLRARKTAYLAHQLRDLDQDDLRALERSVELLEGMLE
jgi:DNA-binding MarR family transcriptional regulator